MTNSFATFFYTVCIKFLPKYGDFSLTIYYTVILLCFLVAFWVKDMFMCLMFMSHSRFKEMPQNLMIRLFS